MQVEAATFGLEINWTKTKIQTTTDPASDIRAHVNGNDVEIVEAFTYLGSRAHHTGSSEPEIIRRISIARESMRSMDKNIWHSQISLDTKLRLYNVFIIPVLLYGADTWTVTAALNRKMDAFDQWCLRRILRIPWNAFITNQEVRSRTQQTLLSELVRANRLKLFGHVVRSDGKEDHARALNDCIAPLPREWRRKVGRPRHTWLRTIEDDLRPLNIGLSSARRRAQDRTAWRQLVTTATSLARPK
jgi:hypothetical protein